MTNMAFYQSLISKFSLLFFSSILFSLQVNAEIYRFDYNRATYSGPHITYRDNAGTIDFITGKFNSDSNNFIWEVTYNKNSSGYLPNGYFLILNNGPTPKESTQGEYAVVYFDATNPTDPKVSIYAYKGGMTISSFIDGSTAPGIQEPDRILSSAATLGSSNNPLGWINEISVTDVGDTRTMKLNIDASIINTHSPLYPSSDPWHGLKFGPFAGDSYNTSGNYIGAWFHPVRGLTTNYYTNSAESRFGFLSSFNYIEDSWFDTNSRYPRVTTESPVCKFINKPEFKLKAGTSFTKAIKFYDPQNDDVTFNLIGAPSGFASNPITGTVFNKGEGIIQFSWTPQVSQIGQFDIGFKFTDVNGVSKICPLSVYVVANEVPTCLASPNGGYSNLSCSQARTTVQLQGSGIDPDNSPSTTTFEWTSNCPNGTFVDSSDPTTNFTFDSENSLGFPTSCELTLTVSDGLESSQCKAPVIMTSCLKDCAGQINGESEFDVCGVCNGNGQSCRDCKGVPFGLTIIDQCGICGGDGQSCLGCQQVSKFDQLLKADGSGFNQRQLVRQISSDLSRTNKSSLVRLARTLNRDADKAYTLLWESLWSRGTKTTQCSNSVLCSTVDTTNLLTNALSGANRLSSLANRGIINGQKLKVFSARKVVTLKKKNRTSLSSTIKEFNTIPKSESVCK